MKVNAVFQGGGVKAIGLVGAVHSAEQHGFSFHEVAGTSSGSIVAAFIAAGYSATEMKQLIIDTPFSSFVKKSWIMQIKVVGPAIRMFVKKGLFSGEHLEYWVQQQLLKKGIRTFGDLRPGQLRIIASDISSGRLLVLPDDIAKYGMNPQKFPVSKAIRMSTSIPYFFDPVILRQSPSQREKSSSFIDQFVYIVDGGLLSNFPLWIFDKNNQNVKTKEHIPTLGFQLVGKTAKQPHRIIGPLSMLQALFSTMMDAHDERYIEEQNDFRTIKVPTMGVGTTQFHIDNETSIKLYNSGYEAAEKFFCKKWSFEYYLNHYDQWIRNQKTIL